MQLLPNGKQQFFTASGQPLANGKVFFYLPNTSTPATTYQDPSGQTPNTNPVILDGNGQAIIYGTGSYRQVVQDANGQTIWDQVTYAPAAIADLSASGPGKGVNMINGAVAKVATVAALRALGTPQSNLVQTVILDGNLAAGDGGGGVFQWFPNASQADDGGIYIMPAGTVGNGRWVRADWHIFSPINVLWYGADPTFTNDATAAIQKAINFGHTDVYVPDGTFMITLDGVNYSGIGVGVGLKLRSNLHIYGPGTLKLKAGSVGSSSNMLANVNGTIDSCIIEGITIDGNKANVTGQTACCTLFSATNSRFIRVKAINSSYVGLMMRGTGSADNQCLYCTVLNPATIGIQFSAHYGALIHGNIIKGTGDNGIDIEGNNLSGVGKITVTDNQLDSIGNIGIFCESMGEISMQGNFIYNYGGVSGIYCNQINTPSNNNLIRGNHFYNATQGKTGIYLNNNIGRCLIEGNFFRNLTSSITCNGGITWAHIGKNTHQAIAKYLINITAATNSLVKSFVDTQIYQGGQDSNGFPKLTSPIAESSNHSDRAYLVNLNGALCLETNANTTESFYYGTSATGTNGAWGGAYAVYTGGDTHVFLTGPYYPNPGDYMKINGTFYYVSARAGQDTTIKNAAQVSGNYASAVNASYTCNLYNATQYTAVTSD